MDEAQGRAGATDGPDFTGCWDIKGPGLDAAFSGRLSDTALDASRMASKTFGEGFPGWEIYRTVVSGDTIFLRRLEAYAIGMARALTRAQRKTGHPEVARRARRNDWIGQAARDALFMVIHGKPPVGINARAAQLGVSNETYQRIRDSVAGGMTIGLEAYRAQLFYFYWKVRRIGG